MRLQNQIEEQLLPFVQEPSQYIGREMNQVVKDWSQCDVRVALGFPDVYKIGMSSLAIQIIYHLLNSTDNVLCERVFCPWTDTADRMRTIGLPLFTLESQHPVREFDIFALSMPYEMLYTNLLEMLDLAGMKPWATERNESDPLVLVGGSQVNNVEPIAEFIDAAILGEAEATLPEFITAYQGLKNTGITRGELLSELAERFEWLYVPSLYKIDYHDDGTIRRIDGRVVKKAIVRNLDEAPYPTRPIVPFHETIHDRINLEILRGCPHACRFCHEGFTRKPVRKRSMEKIIELAEASVANTGLTEISLCSLSSGDYPGLEELFTRMNAIFAPKHVSIGLPSLRVQEQLKLVASQMSTVRKSQLTIALEAGTQRLRDIIGKDIDLANLKPAVIEAYRSGWRAVKLYFMVGLPQETDEDLNSIVDLAVQIAQWRKEVANRPADVNVSVSFMVPKPHTPLQWFGQKKLDYFMRAIELVRGQARRYPYLRISWHDMFRSRLEAIFSRGDRHLAKALYEAWRTGARFDSWDETFSYDRFTKALAAVGLDGDFYANRDIGFDEVLPWDHLRAGFEKDYLLAHTSKK